MERWLPIPGYEGLYEVSDRGSIKSLCAGRWGTTKIRKLVPDKDGYLTICLKKNGKYKNMKVHRLVAMTFLLNPNNYPQINHLDEVKTNNNVNNLEWCTSKYNLLYNNKPQRCCKKVAMIDQDGNTLEVFDSVNLAAESVGVSASHMSTVLSERRERNKLAGGYRWKFV